MKVKEEREKVGLKLNIQKTKIMVSGPITSWQRDGETMETLRDWIFLGSKITEDGDSSHKIKRCLPFGRKAVANIDSILKSRGITLSTKVHLVKAMVFPVVMYGCKSWTIKKSKSRRIEAFEPQCWKSLLRVPWVARRANQSILKETSLECSFEGIMLKLRLQIFHHLMPWTDSLEKTLMLGKIQGWRRKGWQSMRWMDDIINSMDMSLFNPGSWWWTGKPGMLPLWGCKESENIEQLNWTERLQASKNLEPFQIFPIYIKEPLGGGNGNPLQNSCWENPMDRRDWQAAAHGVTNGWTWLSVWAQKEPLIT